MFLQVIYYPSMDYGPDANRTLELKELVVFTDFLDILRAPLTRYLDIKTNALDIIE